MRITWKTPIHAPPIDKRESKSGPVLVLTDGVWIKHAGPITLEQFYGRTSDTMAWQPHGNHWHPPVSYWTKAERRARKISPRGLAR